MAHFHEVSRIKLVLLTCSAQDSVLLSLHWTPCSQSPSMLATVSLKQVQSNIEV